VQALLRPLPKHRNDTPPAGLTFHPFKVVGSRSPIEDVVAPYVNVAVTNNEADLIMNDVRRKLNGYDPNNGLGVLHGLLVHSDNVDLFVKLLELGLDPELRFVYVPAADVKPDVKAIREELNGGTALHFAVRYCRPKCFQALVNAGANLKAKTAAGTGIEGLQTTNDVKKAIVSCMWQMYRQVV
jgi:ankyrin repeat protein